MRENTAVKSVYFFVFVISLLVLESCGPTEKKSDDEEARNGLTQERILAIGNDGGAGKGSGHAYIENSPINTQNPEMPKKKPGLIKDGIYRLRFTSLEGAERALRGPLGKKYKGLVDDALKKSPRYGVLLVSEHGHKIQEWRFEDKENIRKREYEADGQGALNFAASKVCQVAYFTEKVDVPMASIAGAVKLVAYCPALANDEYAKNGITDHHELWEYTYEPYHPKH